MAVTKKGGVLRDTSGGEGLVFVEGNQYAFQLEGIWRSEYAPRTNMYLAMARQAAEQARAEAWKAISFGFGLCISVIASLYLAWHGFRKTRAA